MSEGGGTAHRSVPSTVNVGRGGGAGGGRVGWDLGGTCHASCVMRYALCVMRQTSHVTRHTSLVTRHVLQVDNGQGILFNHA